MNLIGMASPAKGELWQWTGTDKAGKAQEFQTHGPDVSESAMLVHLRRAYPNLIVTNVRRIKSGEYQPPKADVKVDSHAYMHGTRDYFAEYYASATDDVRRQMLTEAHDERPVFLPGSGPMFPYRDSVLIAHQLWERRKSEQQTKSILDRYKRPPSILSR